MCDSNQMKLIKEIALKQNYIDYTVKTGESASKKGENFIGILNRFILIGKKIDGTEESLNLIFKCAPTEETRRAILQIEKAFTREKYIYEIVLTTFTNFEIEHSIPEHLRFKYAKLYAACDMPKEEALVFEDLVLEGYRLQNRRISLDIEHCVAVLRNLAHLHALSFAMKDQKPNEFEQFANLSEQFFIRSFFETGDRIAHSFKRVYLVLDPIKDQDVIKRIENYQEKFLDYVEECSSMEHIGEYGVISHGDSWINNIFFKYENNENPTKPTSVCLIDFQLSRYASPIQDVVYFLYTATDKQLRDIYFDELLAEYYSSLSSNIILLGSDPDKMFPFSEFQRQLKKFAKFGLFASMFLLHVLLCNEDEVFDLSEMVKNRKKIEEMMIQKSLHDTHYRSRLRESVIEMVERNFI